MEILETKINDVFIINSQIFTDERGAFVKTYNNQIFKKNNINFSIKESYYSINKKNVIRGMHFQAPPHDHEKLVYVTSGSIIDVVLDLRESSSTFGIYIDVELSAENKKSIFIPKGLAHGFKALEDNTTTVYNVATEYDVNADMGIRYDSFGCNWQLENPIISKRDKAFMPLKDFLDVNPF